MEIQINLSNCCRTCLRLDCPLTPISAEDEDAIKYSFKLMTCIAEIAWSRMDIPPLICDQCIEQLRISYDFRSTCITADETLQKCIEQAQESKIETKHNILFEPKYDCVTTDTRRDSIRSLPDEDTNNSEYLHLKHFLDSEGGLGKGDTILSENELSRSSTPETTEGRFVNNYNQAQTIEIKVQDKQEIIIQAKPNEVEEQTRLILSDGEYSIQDIHSSTEVGNIEDEQNHIIEHITTVTAEEETELNEESSSNEQNEEKDVDKEMSSFDDADEVMSQFGSSLGKSILGAKQVIPIPKQYAVVKSTKCTGVQVRPPTPQGKTSSSAGNPSTCTICGNNYKKSSSLKVHMRSHTGEKPFECKYCEKRFHRSSLLKEHLRWHTGEKPYHCTVCAKRFTNRGDLTMHMRCHTGEKPYACTVCERRCQTSSNLKRHMRTHTGEKPYTCENCGKKFSSSCTLSSHMKIIHTGSTLYSWGI